MSRGWLSTSRLRASSCGAACCEAGTVEEYGLSDRDPARARDGAVNARLVLVHAHHSLQHLRVKSGRVGVNVQHRAPNVLLRDGDGGSVRAFAERERAT